MFALHELSVSFRVKNLSGYGYSVMVMLFWGTTQTFVLRGDMLAVSTHTRPNSGTARAKYQISYYLWLFLKRGEFFRCFQVGPEYHVFFVTGQSHTRVLQKKKKLGKKVPWTVRKPKSDQPRRTLGTVLSFTEVSFC